jgi:gamma-glutamyltranspeptidase / glutathione hydrolase
VLTRAIGAAAFATVALTLAAQTAPQSPAPRGAREPAWSPDGKRLAFSYLDRIWLSAPDGKNGKALRPETTDIERDPAWSSDGRSIVFAAETGQGFDLVVSPTSGGDVRRLTTLPGDERWPSWSSDGRIVFSHRASGRWRLQVVDAAGGQPRPLFPDTAADDEQQGRVSHDGKRIAYVSDRESEDGDRDLWVAELALGPRDRVTRSRLARVRGVEAFPTWSPDGSRLAFFAVREGTGGVWVVGVPDVLGSTAAAPAPQPQGDGGPGPAPRPLSAAPATLVSRHGGAPSWSPDGKRLAIANLPPPDLSYNGNPERNTDEPPPLFAGADAFRLWLVDAPLPVDSGEREIVTAVPRDNQLLVAFDRVWETLRRLYYSTGPSGARWQELKTQYRSQAQSAQDEAALESTIDAMVAEQPLIKPLVVSDRAVVVSGNLLASRAGAIALERGGNIVDAAIAVSFALGVVEPDASGIGGDGMAVLYLKGMTEPVAIDYKDQVPIRATRDNPLLTAGTGDGPSAANIPGVVAGLDLLYRSYASKKVPWSDLVAPAIDYAENGYDLDTALPTTIAEGRKFFGKYRSSARIYLPDGKVPKAGDRFVNKDYAATLETIAKDGADAFYRGSIARRIADDMAKNGGLITVDDLAQYRAIERRPLAGRYRDHQIYSAPPPVSTGATLIETLQILENYQPKPGTTYSSDADYLHYVIESWRVRDQGPRIADPALWDVSLGPHLDPAHAATLFKRIDPKQIFRDRTSPPADTPPERIGRGTTAFAVVDAEGNMIAVTQTLSTWGGTFYVSDGLGFLYNNHLRFGGGGAPGRFLPLARSSSTSVPTLVFKASASSPSLGTPRLAVGAAGNNWIPASVYDIILNVIDGGMDAQRAIEAPRFLVARDPADPSRSRLQIEDRIPRSVLQDLTARGHRFQKIGRKGEVRYGYAAVAVVDIDRRQVQGGAEPRRSHAAVAVKAAATTPAGAPRER